MFCDNSLSFTVLLLVSFHALWHHFLLRFVSGTDSSFVKPVVFSTIHFRNSFFIASGQSVCVVSVLAAQIV